MSTTKPFVSIKKKYPANYWVACPLPPPSHPTPLRLPLAPPVVTTLYQYIAIATQFVTAEGSFRWQLLPSHNKTNKSSQSLVNRGHERQQHYFIFSKCVYALKLKELALLFYRSRILSTRQKTTFGTKVAFRYAVLEISKLRKDFFTKVKLCFKICIYIYIKLQVCLLNERFFF